MFQSTPAIAGGRIGLKRPEVNHEQSFNPRPPLLAGESGAPQGKGRPKVVFQSTPAIAGGRIAADHAQAAGGSGFNPRPPLLAGESRQIRHTVALPGVSIHARHCWRANRLDTLMASKAYMFQSTPAIAGGRIRRASALMSSMALFHSTPAIAGGRIRDARPVLDGAKLFQSTPAIAGGRIRDSWGGLACFELVSIHARHCWRANRFARNPLWLLVFFNHFRVPARTAS